MRTTMPCVSRLRHPLPGDCLRVLKRYMDKVRRHAVAALLVNTCRRIRFADKPSASKSSSEIRSSADCDTIKPALGGALHHPGGNVHVDTEPVRTDPLRSAGVHAGSHPRDITLHLNGFHCFQCGDHRPHRGRRVRKYRHDAVAHPLDDVAAGLQQRRFDDLCDPPQQLQGGSVAGPATRTRSRPGR